MANDADAEDEAAIEALWSAESERRAHQLTRGETAPVRWEHLLRRIEQRRSSRAAPSRGSIPQPTRIPHCHSEVS